VAAQFPPAIMPGGGTATITSLAGIAGILETFGCFIWLYISAAGPGRWSLDALRERLKG
jgi:uncharacterized membrane protein YphA (DoxX/SURF4 family)